MGGRLDDVTGALSDLGQKVNDALDGHVQKMLAKLDEIRNQVAPNLQALVDQAKTMENQLVTKIEGIIENAAPEPAPAPEPPTGRQRQ